MSDYVETNIGGAVVVSLRPAPIGQPNSSVSMRQAKLALLAADKLQDVESAINAMAEPGRTMALIEWNSASTVDRNHPTVALIAAAAGMNDEEIDALFAAAIQIP